MDISAKTAECITHLQYLMRLGKVDEDDREWAEDQRARLNLWADSLGVFASAEQYTVQARLRENTEVERIICQLLEDLHLNTVLTIRAFQPGYAPERREGQGSPHSDSESDGDGDGDVLSDSADSDISQGTAVKRSMKVVHETLTRLVRLSILLRRETAKDSDAKAWKYDPIDGDGNKLVDEFKSYIDVACKRAFDFNRDVNMGEPPPPAVALQASQQTSKDEQRAMDIRPEEQMSKDLPPTDQPFKIADYLRDRLKHTSTRRWRRLCYQLHQKERTSTRLKPTLPPPLAETQASKQLPVLNRKPTMPPEQKVSKMVLSVVSGKDTLRSGGTLVRKEIKVEGKLDSRTLTIGTASTRVRASQLSFPRAPTVDKSAEEFFCLFCRTLCSTKELRKDKWREHVLRDFEPYFCIYDDCDRPEMTYRTADLWTKHLQESHSLTKWSCHQCPATTFETAEAFTAHLRQHYPENVTEEQLRVATSMQARKSPPILAACPFCGYTPETLTDSQAPAYQRDVNKHMETTHLQPFALMSIPWDVAASDAADSGRQTHISQSSGVSKDLKEQILQDSDLEAALADDTIQANGEHAKAFVIIKAHAQMPLSLEDAIDRWITKIDFDFDLDSVLEASFGNKVVESQYPSWQFDHLGSIMKVDDRRSQEPDRIAERMHAESVYQNSLTRYGLHHQHTLTDMTTLVDIYNGQGLIEQAAELESKVFLTKEQLFGAAHVESLASLNRLANLYAQQGRLEEAQALMLRLLDSSIVAIGFEHTSTLNTMGNLGWLYMQKEQWHEAENMLTDLMARAQRMLGEDHPIHLTAMRNLRIIYLKQLRWAEAEGLLVQLVDKARKVYGDSHPMTLTAMSDLASSHLALERDKMAEGLLLDLLPKVEEGFGDDAPTTTRTMSMIGDLRYRQGRFNEAEQLHVKALRLRAATLGEDHPDTLGSMVSLSSAYRAQGAIEYASTLESRARSKLGETPSEPHKTTDVEASLLHYLLHEQTGERRGKKYVWDVTTARGEHLEIDYYPTESVDTAVGRFLYTNRLSWVHQPSLVAWLNRQTERLPVAARSQTDSSTKLEAQYILGDGPTAALHGEMRHSTNEYPSQSIQINEKSSEQSTAQGFPKVDDSRDVLSAEPAFIRAKVLHDAIRARDTDAVSAASLSELVNVEDEHGYTALHVLVCARQQVKSEQALDSFLSAENKLAEFTNRLLEADCNINAWQEHIGTPLCLAALYGDVTIARILLEHGADPFIGSSLTGSPMHSACISGSLGVVSLLLEFVGVDFERTDRVRLTDEQDDSLALAPLVFDVPRMEMDLRWPPRPTFHALAFAETEVYELQPLTLAAYFGRIDIMKLLINQRHAVDCIGTWELRNMLYFREKFTHTGSGMTPLFLASAGDQVEALRLLIESGCNIEHTASDNDTAASAAVSFNAFRSLKFLASCGADLHRREASGFTFIMYAARKGFLEIIQFLIGHGVSVDAVSDDGSTAMMIAAEAGQTQAVELLLKHPTDVNRKDEDGNTALLLAVPHAKTALIDLLLEAGADAQAVNNKGETCLHLMKDHGDVDVLRSLLEAGADPNIYLDGDTILNNMILMDDLERTELLVQHGADVNKPSDDDMSPLHIAGMSGLVKIASLLLDHGAKIDAVVNGYTVLAHAAEYNIIDSVRLFLERGADPNFAHGSEKSPLRLATGWGRTTVVEMLLNAGASIDDDLVLGNVVRSNRLDIVEQLLQHGFDPIAYDAKGDSMLIVAARQGHTEIMEALLKAMSYPSVDELDLCDFEGRTALMLSSQAGHLAITKMLCEYGSNVNALDRDHWSALNYAINNGHVEIVACLMQHRADADFMLETWPAFSLRNIWTRHNGITILDLLGESGVRLEQYDDADSTNHTALEYATKKNNVEALRVLIKHGVHKRAGRALIDAISLPHSDPCVYELTVSYEKLSISQRSLEQALHDAVELNYEAAVEFLSKTTVSLDAKRSGITPLMNSVQRGQPLCVARLISAGAKVDLTDDSHHTAAYYAFSSYSSQLRPIDVPEVQTECLRLLLDAQCSPDGIGLDTKHLKKTNRTLLEYAARIEDQDLRRDTIQMLLDHKAQADLTNGHSSLLHQLAAVPDRADNIRQVVHAGGSIFNINSAGMTPLMEAARRGNIDCLQTILELLDDSIISEKDFPDDEAHENALMIALRCERSQCAVMLLEAGFLPQRSPFTKRYSAKERTCFLDTLYAARRSVHSGRLPAKNPEAILKQLADLSEVYFSLRTT